MNLRRIYFMALAAFACAVYGNAQEQEIRTLYLQKFEVNEDWTISFDGGYYNGVNEADYGRWGIRNVTSFKISDAVTIDAGLMYNRIDIPDVGIKNEFRPHQTIKVAFPNNHSLSLKHRFRFEEQFFTYNYQAENNSSTRLRYQIQTKRAFDFSENISAGSAYWMASSELFLNIEGKIQDDYNLLKRSRYGLGLGYKISSATSLEGNIYFQRTYSNTSMEDYSNMAIFNFYIKNTLFANKHQENRHLDYD